MEQLVYSIPEFCTVHRISRSRLYLHWKEKTGPVFFHSGSKVLITREAAAAWRADREKAAVAESQPAAA
jgi:hypothetical protein